MNFLNGKTNKSVVSQGDNAQMKANMTVVHNILNGGTKVESNISTFELELAA